MHESRDQISELKLPVTAARALLTCLLLFMILLVWFSWRWYLGSTLAEFAPPVDQGGTESARYAVRLAPDDPLSHWVLGNMEKATLDPSRLPAAVAEYEAAVRLSPNDYRYWQDLGRAREQAGDIAGGEAALLRAIDLAPAYARPRWYLGNLLLRAGRVDDAFAQLHRAGDSSPALRSQVYVFAWRFLHEDVAAIERALGTSSEAKAQLALFLADHERPADAVRIWSSLPVADRQQLRDLGLKIVTMLYEKRSFPEALQLESWLRPNVAGLPGAIANAGFEGIIGGDESGLFNWHVAREPQAEISVDLGTRYEGTKSLRVVFDGFSSPTFTNIWQVVILEPGTKYRLEFYVKTRELQSGGQPMVEVVNASTAKVIAASATLSVGTTDWQKVAVDFETSADTRAVTLRTNRLQCAAGCPIFGTVWYDDFRIQRVGAATDSGKQRQRADEPTIGKQSA